MGAGHGAIDAAATTITEWANSVSQPPAGLPYWPPMSATADGRRDKSSCWIRQSSWPAS